MSKKELSRRDFLLRTSALGAVAFGSSALLSACGGGQEQAPAGGGEPAPAEEPMAEPMAEATCDDLSGLSDADVQMRQTLQYVGKTPIADKTCIGCQLYVPPEGEGPCGGCQIIKGPIAPEGYCTSWAQKMT